MMEDVKHKFMTLFASFFFSSFVVYSVKTGIKAEFKAPSATIPLKKFGIIKAIRKASYMKVVPKKLALVISLKSPKMREIIVPIEIMETALRIFFELIF